MNHSLECGNRISMSKGISFRNSTLSVEFIENGVPLGENGDESRVSGGVSGKIHSVRASENADDGVRGGEGVQGKVKKKEEVLPLVANALEQVKPAKPRVAKVELFWLGSDFENRSRCSWYAWSRSTLKVSALHGAGF